MTHSADNGWTFHWFTDNEKKKFSKSAAWKALFIHCILVNRMFSSVLWASSDIDTLLPIPYFHIFTVQMLKVSNLLDWFPWVLCWIRFNVEFLALQQFSRWPAMATIGTNKSWLQFIYFFFSRPFTIQSPNLIFCNRIFRVKKKMVTNSLEHQIFVHGRNL